MTEWPRRRAVIPIERIAAQIYVIRGESVMLDADLAELYHVETGALVRAMKRNLDRSPEDFAFHLTKEEFDDLRSQTGISSWGGRRYAPYAFTEQGVATALYGHLNPYGKVPASTWTRTSTEPH